jgi:CBS domain containing-hemolysin-like protein
MVTALYLLLVLFLVPANGFFVASEFALVGVRRSRVEALKDREGAEEQYEALRELSPLLAEKLRSLMK